MSDRTVAPAERVSRLRPPHLAERTRAVGGGAARPKGEWVLYWLHHAMRAHDNPALDESPLSWIARNNSKPHRDGDWECWVLHASSEWSEAYLDAQPGAVLPRLTDAFRDVSGARRKTPNYTATHLWRYAIPPAPLEHRCLFDVERRIGACGDWRSGPRVEGAFLSGMAMAGHVLRHAPDFD